MMPVCSTFDLPSENQNRLAACLVANSTLDREGSITEALPVHRALRHHSAGIFEAQQVFGRAITNSAGRSVPVRFIAEQHVREDCRRIPSVSDWLRGIPVEPWMVNGVILPDVEALTSDPQADWRAAVASGQTVLGFRDWLAMQAQRLNEDMERDAVA